MDTLLECLECAICLNTLDLSNRVLPCQHTFCKKCLEAIVRSRKELRCPECRTLFEASILSQLPPNVLLMRILEGMKSMSTTSTTTPEKLPNSSGNASASTEAATTKPTTTTTTETESETTKPSDTKVTEASTSRNPESLQATATTTAVTTTRAKSFEPVQARAIHDFQSKESGDLNFKKGDMIFLKKKIDKNWCVGELNGKTGTFPINHVQVSHYI